MPQNDREKKKILRRCLRMTERKKDSSAMPQNDKKEKKILRLCLAAALRMTERGLSSGMTYIILNVGKNLKIIVKWENMFMNMYRRLIVNKQIQEQV